MATPDSEQLCLRWNYQQSTLISAFGTLLENQALVDVTLAAEGKYLKVHKLVLSACSKYFQEILINHAADKYPIIYLENVKYFVLEALVNFMYKGEVNITHDQLSYLLDTAESLKIKGLSKENNDSSNVTKTQTSLTEERSLPVKTVSNNEMSAGTMEPPTVPRKRRKESTENSNNAVAILETESSEFKGNIDDNKKGSLDMTVEYNDATIQAGPSLTQARLNLVENSIDTSKSVNKKNASSAAGQNTTGNYRRPKVYQCKKCSRSYSLKHVLNRHIRNECCVEPKFQCVICKLISKHCYNIKRHIINKHRDVKYNKDLNSRSRKNSSKKKGIFPCFKCKRVYNRLDSLSRHLKWECGLLPQFECILCGKKFTRKDRLERHQKTKKCILHNC